jgi:FkbM family methyltransferase
VDFVLALLASCLRDRGEGVLAIDCGANIGVHTIEMARFMYTWGHVVAFEAQEKIYYALCGNIALNNCLNVNALNSAVGEHCGQIDIPEPDYLRPGSFGSVELQQSASNEFIGQALDYQHRTIRIDLVSLDSLGLQRIDFIKIDVEGMEEQVLRGPNSPSPLPPADLHGNHQVRHDGDPPLAGSAGLSPVPAGRQHTGGASG